MIKHLVVKTVLLAVLALFTCIVIPAQAGPGDALSSHGTSYVSATIPTLASNYTVSAWVYLWQGGNSSSRMGVLTGTGCGDSVEFMVHSWTDYVTDPQSLELGRCGAFNGTASTSAVPINQWAQVAVTVDVTFTTAGAVPMLTTLAAAKIGAASATLNGTVNPNGLATGAWFQWGVDASYGNVTAVTEPAATNVTLAVTNLLTGLAGGRCIIFAQWRPTAWARCWGGDVSFTPVTCAAPPTFWSGLTAAWPQIKTKTWNESEWPHAQPPMSICLRLGGWA